MPVHFIVFLSCPFAATLLACRVIIRDHARMIECDCMMIERTRKMIERTKILMNR